MSKPSSCLSSVQELLQILCCGVACYANSRFKYSFFLSFQVSPVFILGTLDFNFRHMSGDVNVGGCFLGMLDLGIFPWPDGFMCVLAFLLVWYCDMELTPLSSVLLLLSTCNMARGQEETSTSQAGRKRGPGRDTPSTNSIISSLSKEELRSYCHIPDDIDCELPDGPAKSTIDKEDGAVYFTREQLVARLRFPISSLIKKFLHFSGALPTLVHPNIIWILSGCTVLNLLYQLDISLVEVFFIYTLKLAHGGRLSLSAQNPRLQFVTGLHDSPKTVGEGRDLS